MKHIAIVVPEFPIASETFVVTEIRALAKAGHQVTVFCFIKRESPVTLPVNVDVIDVNTASNKQVSTFVAKHPLARTKAFTCAKHQLDNLIKKLKLKSLVRLLGYRSPHGIAQKGANYDGFVAPFCVSEETGYVASKDAV
ncbi:hypothetical protein [Moritella yayanosii]|uniref:Uncharacterized protein n=1 Tax=Moritella yayanosii TaxID=69539 RepID=A0A330LPA6_9GAMM|nr:hypothetical protein [Moritella yayanosii]SQD78036.1 protein of unknown function, might belong to Glycosyltransferase [Moritella yayanosii]